MRPRGATPGNRSHVSLAGPALPAPTAAEPTVMELRMLTERLLLAGLREQEIADAGRMRFDEEHRVRSLIELAAAKVQVMLGQVSEGIVVTDATLNITYSNTAARRILGLVEPAISHQATAGPLVDPYLTEQLARAVSGHETTRHLRWQNRRPDATAVVTEGTLAPFYDVDGALMSAVIELRDVTDEAELELQRDEALANVVHDLRRPLTTILGFSQMLSRRLTSAHVPGADPWLASLGQIDRAAKNLNAMIDDLLDLGRLQSGQALGLALQPTDLVALTCRVMANLQPIATGHHLNLDSVTKTLVGQWDCERLERALGNLLDNAIKYSLPGGAVNLRIEREANPAGDIAVLSVEDHGIGISATDLPHVFERFWRGSNVAGRIAGTGIGLASAQQIALQHGGTLTVASTRGQGSTFTLRLPLAPPVAIQPPPA